MPSPPVAYLSPPLALTPPSTSPHRSTHPYPCSFSSAGGRRRRRCGRPGDRGHRRTRRRGRRCLLVHQGAILTMAMLTMAILTIAMITMAVLTMAMLTMAMLTMAMLTMASPTGAPRCGAWRRGKAVTPCAQAVTPIAPYALHPMHQAVPLLHLGISMCQVRYRRYLAAILRYLSPQVRGKTAGPGAPPATLEAPPPPPPPPPPMPPSDLPPGWQQAADPTTGTAAGWRVAPWDIYIYVYTCICVPSWARHGSAARPPTLLGPTR